MKDSTKAALLSGLVFPGIGHMMLKHYLRGTVLMFSSLIAFWLLVDGAYQSARTIVDGINSGDIALEANAILAAASASGASTGSLLPAFASIVLLACWLFGIVDSYRLGAIAPNEQEPAR